MDSEPTSQGAGAVIADRYELAELIGRGGHGLVWSARDRETDRRVAVKMLTDVAARDPQQIERLKREQQAMTTLAGTSAVEVMDLVSAAGGQLCLVMELLEGEDFEHRLERLEQRGDRLPMIELFRVLEPIVTTLERAHQNGILHRDLKPANIFLVSPTVGGGVRLLDFGLARLRSALPLTAAGTIVGSPSYIAPEVWKGRSDRLDQRVDVYSFGVLVFRALSGNLPFAGKTLQEKFLLATTAERPSIRQHRPDLSPEMDEWVAQVLAIDPDLRFRTMRGAWGALLGALEGAAESEERISQEAVEHAPSDPGPVETPPRVPTVRAPPPAAEIGMRPTEIAVPAFPPVPPAPSIPDLPPPSRAVPPPPPSARRVAPPPEPPRKIRRGLGRAMRAATEAVKRIAQVIQPVTPAPSYSAHSTPSPAPPPEPPPPFQPFEAHAAPLSDPADAPKPEGSMVREWLAGSEYQAADDPDAPPPSKVPASLRTTKADAAGTVMVAHVVAVEGPRIGPPSELIDEKKSYVREWLVGSELNVPAETSSGDVVSWLGGSEAPSGDEDASGSGRRPKRPRGVPKPPRPADKKKAEREAKKAEREAQKAAKEAEKAAKEADRLAKTDEKKEKKKEKRKLKKRSRKQRKKK